MDFVGFKSLLEGFWVLWWDSGGLGGIVRGVRGLLEALVGFWWHCEG